MQYFVVLSKYTISCTFTEIQFRSKYKHMFSGEICFLVVTHQHTKFCMTL
uniref:Uncharacterized protein n=1 Tax=Anguilla anguilla TaxID=7936 RepID=A0A0E9T8H2_ANGAN